MQLYRYTSLNNKRNEIRLFHLNPGNYGEIISGTLQTVSLDDKPRYDALSYVWGTPEPKTVIQLDGHSALEAGPNLAKALKGLRKKKKERILWIDAICINQADDAEKQHHIPLMGRIYSQARVVRAWLDGDFEGAATSRALRRLVKFKYAGEWPKVDRAFAAPSDLYLPMKQRILRKLALRTKVKDYEPSFWEPVLELLSKPYWTRLWVQQEYLLARRLVCHCGQYIVPGEQLFRFQDAIFAGSSEEYSDPDLKIFGFSTEDIRSPSFFPFGLLSIGAQWVATSKKQASGRGLLEMILRGALSLNVTVTLDYIYGCIGLFPPGIASRVRVDYTLDFTQVLADVINATTTKEWPLYFLCYKSFMPVADDHPTWMPSPARKSVLDPMEFTASVCEEQDTPRPVTMNGNRLTVSAKAVVCDVVSRSAFSLSDNLRVSEWCDSMSRLFEEGTPCYEEPEWWRNSHFLQLIWRMLAADEGGPTLGGYEPTRDDIRLLFQWLAREAPRLGNWYDLYRGQAQGDDKARVKELLQYEENLSNNFFVTTESGTLMLVRWANMGLVPGPGDQVFALDGCPFPLVLQLHNEPTSGPSQYQLVGSVNTAAIQEPKDTYHFLHEEVLPDGTRRRDALETIELI